MQRAQGASPDTRDNSPFYSGAAALIAHCNVARAISTCTTGSDIVHRVDVADDSALPDFEQTSFPHAFTRITAIRPTFQLTVPLLDFNPGPRNVTAVFKFFWDHVQNETACLDSVALQEPQTVTTVPSSPDVEVLLSILAPDKVVSLQRRGIFDAYVSREIANLTGNWGVTGRVNPEDKWDWNGTDFARYALTRLRLANLVATRWPDALQVASEDWMADPVTGTERLIDYLAPSGAPGRPDWLHEQLVAFADREIVPLDPRGERARSVHLMAEYCANYGDFAAAVVQQGWGNLIGL